MSTMSISGVIGLTDSLTPAAPDRRVLQAAGTHPAPCARHCEAKAFEIEIRRLKAALGRRTGPVGTAKDLFTIAVLERLDVRPSTKVYLDAPRTALEQAEPAVWECKAGGLKPLTQRQYDMQPANIQRHYTQLIQMTDLRQPLNEAREILVKHAHTGDPLLLIKALHVLDAALAASAPTMTENKHYAPDNE